MTEIILGPPGTGKTTALISIVEEELAAGTPPHRIGFVSFTRRAAEEAQERACERFNLSQRDLPWFRTLHSLCFRVLGLRRGEVMEGEVIREFAVWAGITLTGKFIDDGSMLGYSEGDRILHMEHLARVRGVPLRQVYEEDNDNLPWSEVERVERHLRGYKIAARKTDYTDMLRKFIDGGDTPRLDVLLVDEAQDLSWIQWQVVDKLAAGVRRVVYAGDDDQGIYRWAGADPSYLADQPHPARVLGQSYRVPRAVQALAADVIGRVSHRREKKWAPRDAEGEVRRVGSIHEAEIEEGDVMVLARNTYVLSTIVVPELRRRGIYYAWGSRGAVSPDVLRVIQDWEALRRGGTIAAGAARRVYEYISVNRGFAIGHRTLPAFPEGDEPVSMADLRERGGLLTDAIWHEALDKIPMGERDFILAARRRGERVTGTPRVKISTIHGAKGGEADHVVLFNDLAQRTARDAQTYPDDEARVWYVAATRARQQLTIIDDGQRENRYNI